MAYLWVWRDLSFVNECLCIAPRTPAVMVTTLNSLINVGHNDSLFEVELPWV